MLYSHATRWHNTVNYLHLVQWSHLSKTFRGRYWASVLALQSNSSNCLVLKPHIQFRNYLLGSRENHSLTVQHICKTIIRQCLPPTNKVLLIKAQESMLNQILVLICGRDICWKIVSSWSRKSGPVTYLPDGHWGATSCQSHRHHSTLERPMDICTLAKCSLPKKKSFWHRLTWAGCHSQNQGGYLRSIWLLLKRFSMPNTSCQIKYRAQINTVIWFNTKLRCRVAAWSILLPNVGKISQHDSEQKCAYFLCVARSN